jgi:hypothetical protein
MGLERSSLLLAALRGNDRELILHCAIVAHLGWRKEVRLPEIWEIHYDAASSER